MRTRLSSETGHGPEERTSLLGREYVALAGRELLNQLRVSGRADVLEAFWRYENSDIMAAVAPQLAAAGSESLSSLLLDFVLDTEAAEPPASAVLSAISKHTSPLTDADLDRLVDRLMDPEDLAQPCQRQREVLEIWALGQRGDRANGLARAVIAKETPKSLEAAVRKAAIERCRGDDQLLAETFELLGRELRTEQSVEAWENASSFVSAVFEDGFRGDAHRKLAREMALTLAQLPGDSPTTAARGTSAGEFHVAERVAEMLQKAAAKSIRELFEGDPLDTKPPRITLARVALGNPDARRRWAALKALVASQPGLWAATWPNEVDRWDEPDWQMALDALLKVAKHADPAEIAKLLAKAPNSCSARAMQLAIMLSRSGTPQLTQAAGALVKSRVADWIAAEEPIAAGDAAFWWPDEPDEDVCDELGAMLSGVPEDHRPGLVVDAFAREFINAQTAAAILESSLVRSAIETADEKLRRALTLAFYRAHPDATKEAVKELQDHELSMALVEAMARHDPEVAFAPLVEQWAGLESTDRDTVIVLLEAYATSGQQRLLDVIANDTLNTNADRRRRAVAKTADLADIGGEVPQAVISMLSAGNAANRHVGVEGIRKLRPRSLEAVQALRQVADNPDPAGRDAKIVLGELAELYVSELEAHPGRDERISLLQLLGRTADGAGIPIELAHLGQDAIDDHADVRIAAAKALLETARAGTTFDVDQQRLVGTLLGEEGGEDTTEARELLSQVLSHLTLGPDQALTVLYGTVDLTPRQSPDELYGPERAGLVRHLQLYNQELSRGDSARPQRLMQLDLIALKLLRAAYLRVGTSEPMRDLILLGGAKPEIGEILQAVASVPQMQAVRESLGMVHRIRSERTEYAHPGVQPTDEDEETALTCFKSGAKHLLGLLTNAAGEPWPQR